MTSPALQSLAALLALAVASAASAKLPAPTDEAKAKAAEASAKSAWSDKVAAFKLCKVQDAVAASYHAAAKKAGNDKPATETPACADPGAFVYAPPEPKPPIEQAGAHSPAKTATAPPSTTTPQAALPAKK